MLYRVLDSKGGILPFEAESFQWAAEDWYDVMCLFPAAPSYPILVVDEGGDNVLYRNEKEHNMGKSARSKRFWAREEERKSKMILEDSLDLSSEIKEKIKRENHAPQSAKGERTR